MADFQNIVIPQYDDGVLSFELQAPFPIGGMALSFQILYSFGSTTNLVKKVVASGFNNTSGIQIVSGNPGAGIPAKAIINLYESDLSGLGAGPFTYALTRTDSGFHTQLTVGYITLPPGNLG